MSTDTSSPYSFSQTGLANGSHSLVVTCFDAGNPVLSTASAARAFTVGPTGGNTAPVVTLTAPTSGQSFAAGAAVTLSATATDNSGVIRVEFRVDGNLGVERHDVTVQLQRHGTRGG